MMMERSQVAVGYATGLAKSHENVPKKAMECNVHHLQSMMMKRTMLAVDPDGVVVVCAVAAAEHRHCYWNYFAKSIGWSVAWG